MVQEGGFAAAEGGPVLPPQVADINELIGYKIQRYWPEVRGFPMPPIAQESHLQSIESQDRSLVYDSIHVLN